MASREYQRKEALRAELAAARSRLRIPDKGDLTHQGKNLLSLAGKLPGNVTRLNTRTLVITATLSFLLVVFLKPKRKKRRKEMVVVTGPSPFSRRLLAWGFTAAQPFLRSYLKSLTRSWLTRKAARSLVSLGQKPISRKIEGVPGQDPPPAG